MSAKVINIGCITRLDLPAERVLDAAKANMDSVVLLGYDKDGFEYFASTIADGGDVLWLLERCKQRLFDMCSGD